MKSCIFCKILQKEIPSYKIYEDEYVYAFLDISQTTPGHTLLVPKRHVKDIFSYDDKLAQAVFARLPKIAQAILKSDPKILGMNIINNNGAVAYQSVFHSHIHLIPRYSSQDGFSIHFTDNSNQYNNVKYQDIQTSILHQMEEK